MRENAPTPIGAVYKKDGRYEIYKNLSPRMDCEVVAVYEQSTIDALQARAKELEESFSKQYGDMKTEIDRLTVNNGLLEAQRDELLAASIVINTELKTAWNVRTLPAECFSVEAIQKFCAAISKIEAEKAG